MRRPTHVPRSVWFRLSRHFRHTIAEVERRARFQLPKGSGPGWRVDQHGRPISLGAWVALFQDTRSRLLALSGVAGVTISTVWIGLLPDCVFETMTFGPGKATGGPWRSLTIREARRRHRAIVDKLRRGLN